MGTILSLSLRDQKMSLWNEPNRQPLNGFHYKNYQFQERYNNLKNKEKDWSKNKQINGGPHHYVKKSSFINLCSINLGKHFIMNGKKKQSKRDINLEKSKDSSTFNQKFYSHFDQNNCFLDKNCNLVKSFSCYNLKSEVIIHNLDKVHHTTQPASLSFNNQNNVKKVKKEEYVKKFQPLVGQVQYSFIIKKSLPPPLPPKPSFLMSRNTIRPVETKPARIPKFYKNGITLTRKGSHLVSSTRSERKIIVQVSTIILCFLSFTVFLCVFLFTFQFALTKIVLIFF